MPDFTEALLIPPLFNSQVKVVCGVFLCVCVRVRVCVCVCVCVVTE